LFCRKAMLPFGSHHLVLYQMMCFGALVLWCVVLNPHCGSPHSKFSFESKVSYDGVPRGPLCEARFYQFFGYFSQVQGMGQCCSTKHGLDDRRRAVDHFLPQGPSLEPRYTYRSSRPWVIRYHDGQTPRWQPAQAPPSSSQQTVLPLVRGSTDGAPTHHFHPGPGREQSRSPLSGPQRSA